MPADLVAVRSLAIGAVPAIMGALLIAAPLPAGGGVVGYLIAAGLVAIGWHRSRLELPRFGLANAVTLARLVGTGWILALLLQAVWIEPTQMISLTIVGLGSICLVLDGVDGRIARRRGETSAFGARFDVETDAATTLILCLTLPVLGVTGWWVMAIGALRYLYIGAGLLQPALRQPLRYSRARRVIGTGQAIALLLALGLDALLPGPTGWLSILPAAALVALLWSFGRDIREQLRA
ncbi:MAG TPA: CDP-alcohol phosphatidyltransferase family protein [Microlunatus sp.]